MKQKIILRNGLSPGDIGMMAVAIRDLMMVHSDKFEIDVRTPCSEIFMNNPFITPLKETDPDVKVINAQYEIIHKSNQCPVHFIHGYRHDLEEKLGVKIPCGTWDGAIFISDQEKSWFSAMYERLQKDEPYWVIDAGFKKDFTCKQWDFERWQQVVDMCPNVWFAQIGVKHDHHVHPTLKGDNVVSFVGKTDLRQLIRLIYNAYGVVTPVSMPMVMSYLIPAHPRFGRKSRACVVVAGGREPNHWQSAANQQFLHTCGMLPCCDYGGCWKSRVVPIGDGDEKDKNNLCLAPVTLGTGQIIPKCMDMIKAEEVANCIQKYVENLQINNTKFTKIVAEKKPEVKLEVKPELKFVK